MTSRLHPRPPSVGSARLSARSARGQPRHHLEAHAAVVVRAFPETDLLEDGHDLAGLRYPAKPLAMRPVDDQGLLDSVAIRSSELITEVRDGVAQLEDEIRQAIRTWDDGFASALLQLPDATPGDGWSLRRLRRPRLR